MLNPRQPTVAEAIAGLPRLLQLGRLAEAEAAARSLQRQFPERGDANEALALVLVNLNKHAEAFPFAEAAVKAEPRNAGYLINLGRLFLQYELIEEALPVLEKAFRIDPSMYQAPWAMGEFFHKTGNGQRAIRYLKQAIAASPPADKSDIEKLYADCLSSLDEIDEAERLYQALAAHERHRQFALVQIAGLRKHKTDSSIFETLQQELRTDANSPADLMRLHLAVGRIHENSGEYDKAFDHFKQSKSSLANEFDLGKFTTTVDNIIEDYQPDVLRRFEGYGDPSRLPVFVVGMPRSGTTLTEQIIAAHPKGGGAGELKRVGRMQQGLSEEKRPSHLFARLTEGGPERCRELATRYVSLLKFLAPGAKRVVDKMPHNFIALGFIAILFPNARIVHCVRNPADNFISAFQNPMHVNHGYSYAVEDYALYYKEYLRLMRHWQWLLPERIFTLRYEEMAASPEEKIRQMLEFLGLPWDSRVLRFHERGAMVKTFSRQQVRQAVHQGSVERWRNYEEQLRPLAGILKDEMGN
ncbi:MAG: sulfotransferase [Rhizobiales bacterium]|nr:sulfotransferase [Hyphomicrobiales bacterium]